MSTDIIIITGKINSGKTSACKTLISEQKRQKKEVGGILSLPVWRRGEKNTYYAVDIATEEGTLLATTGPVSPCIRYGRFRFPLSGFVFACSALYRAAGLSDLPAAEMIIIDELGPLELLDRGFAPALKTILQTYTGTLILVTRETHTGEIRGHFGIPRGKEICL
jgi:nucleoside-triphosphatase THEP1